jgi:hypothetical protein
VLIEAAFLKLPELLLSNFDYGSEVEATVTHLLAAALHMELNSRNIPRPYTSVLTEKPYDGVPAHFRRIRADLYVDLSKAVDFGQRMLAYGVRPKNWLEAKAPLQTRRRSRRSLPVDLFTRDYMRVCLLPRELQGPSTATENGRYLLWVFDTDPRSGLSSDSWIRTVLEPSTHSATVEMDGIRIEGTVRTMSFEPDTANAATPLFWGYLLRIGRFAVSGKGRTFQSRDAQGTGYSQPEIANIDALREAFLSNAGSESEGA